MADMLKLQSAAELSEDVASRLDPTRVARCLLRFRRMRQHLPHQGRTSGSISKQRPCSSTVCSLFYQFRLITHRHIMDICMYIYIYIHIYIYIYELIYTYIRIRCVLCRSLHSQARLLKLRFQVNPTRPHHSGVLSRQRRTNMKSGVDSRGESTGSLGSHAFTRNMAGALIAV